MDSETPIVWLKVRHHCNVAAILGAWTGILSFVTLMLVLQLEALRNRMAAVDRLVEPLKQLSEDDTKLRQYVFCNGFYWGGSVEVARIASGHVPANVVEEDGDAIRMGWRMLYPDEPPMPMVVP